MATYPISPKSAKNSIPLLRTQKQTLDLLEKPIVPALTTPMAKKRKNAPKDDEPKKEIKLEEPPSVESEEDEDGGFEEEEEDDEEEASSSEEDEDEEEAESEESEEEEEDDEVSKRETVRKLLQPFGRDQLIDILKQAATTNRSIVADVIASADSDPVHRTIFVHGLGWDTTNETLTSTFKQYGQIEECNVVTDKITGRSKGYGFVLFKKRAGARKALKEPQKKIGNRMTACQLASAGPVANFPVPDVGGRKLYVANVGPQMSVEKLRSFFATFGEIEEGPLGTDKQTGKFRGFAIIIYKTAAGIKKALEEPVKMFEGCKLQCSRATEGRSAKNNPTGPVVAGSGATVAPNNLALPTYPVGLNQGFPAGILMGQNPALGVLSPVFGAGAALNPTGLSPSFAGGVSQAVNNRGVTNPPVGLSPGFGVQPGINTISPSVIGSYGSQAALQGLGAYQSPQLGQSSASAGAAARSHSGIGSVGSLPSYFGR